MDVRPCEVIESVNSVIGDLGDDETRIAIWNACDMR